nr:hypothetical protein GCM10025699_16660 [Microbacterium flavescens]
MVTKAAKEAANGAPEVRTVIVAAEPITDIDTTAMDDLVDLDEYLEQRGIELVLAEVKGPIRDLMQKHGMSERFPPDRFPPTVGAAVDAETGSMRSDIGGIGEAPTMRADRRIPNRITTDVDGCREARYPSTRSRRRLSVMADETGTEAAGARWVPGAERRARRGADGAEPAGAAAGAVLALLASTRFAEPTHP